MVHTQNNTQPITINMAWMAPTKNDSDTFSDLEDLQQTLKYLIMPIKSQMVGASDPQSGHNGTDTSNDAQIRILAD